MMWFPIPPEVVERLERLPLGHIRDKSRWYPRSATDADMRRPDRRLAIANDSIRDIDICAECGEHAGFDENGSECCGAGAYDSDPDVDMER